MQNTQEKLRSYAPFVLRVGISLVFLWFGTQELIHTEAWVNLIPKFMINISHLDASTFVHLNGAFEIVFGLALLLGIFTTFTASLLALHMFGILFTVGYSAIGVRDFGLAIATLAIAFFGPDRYTLASIITSRQNHPRENQ